MGAHQEGEAGDDAHGVDIDSLARQLREELAAANSSAVQVQLTGGCPIIIAEVGSLTRNVDAAEYDPHHVAIGPYHRLRNPDLARNDEKIRCLNAVLSAASNAAAATTLEVYLDEIANLEIRARSCYAHSFSLESREFVRMLLLDGCYLLVRFGDVVRRANGAAAGKGGATTVLAPAAGGGGGDMLEAVAVVRDVFYLAENQIPFFVIDKIHQLTRSDTTVSAVDAIAGYVRELLRRQQYSVATPALSEPTVPGNLLHLLHMNLVPTVHPPRTSDDNKVSRKRRVGRWKTATEYHLAGVKFKSRPVGGGAGNGGARSILDVRLDAGGGTLEIPRLNIDGETWRLLRNLMALEQRNPEITKSHVTAYCVFVSQLACTASDVEFLARRGVVSHGLGNHGEVAALFSDLCKGVVFCADDPEQNYLRGVCQALESGVRCHRRRWMVWLRRTYFSNPWLVLGLAAAVLGLVCTMVQAVYSVLSYRQGGR
ncbi:unnamed protein product [Urochloa decumbens]|uniref:Uncharacterized protein n=1 Tax=Urochloa decumbens TaxID=240449 RepID=A0ABC9BZY3_9POAL